MSIAKDRILIDWLTLRISMPYQVLPDKEYESDHHRLVPGARSLFTSYDIAEKLIKCLHLLDDQGLDAWKLSQSSWPYDVSYVRDGFKIYFNVDTNGPEVRKQMGCKLDIQGRGCRYLDDAFSRQGLTWKQFFEELAFVFGEYLSIRRLDLARDYFKKAYHLSPQGLYKRLERTRRARQKGLPKSEWQVFSKKKHFEFIESAKVSGEVTGATLYVGKSQDSLMLRVYDKTAERVYSHGDTWEKYRHPNWIRYEFQTRGEVSEKIVKALVEGKTAGQIWLSCMARTMTILPTNLEKKRKKTVQVKYTARTKTKKLSVPKWWAQFTSSDQVDKLHLVETPREKMDLYSDSWLGGAVGHTMYGRLVAEVLMGGDPATLLSHWLRQGSAQLSQKDIDAIKIAVAGLHIPGGGEAESYAKSWTEKAKKLFGEQALASRFAQEDEIDYMRDRERFEQGLSLPGTMERYGRWIEGKNSDDK